MLNNLNYFVFAAGSNEEEGEQEEQSRSDGNGDSSDEVDNITNAGSISELLERAHGDIGDALRPTASSTANHKRKKGKTL